MKFILALILTPSLLTAQSGPIAIRNVTVVDVTSVSADRALLPSQTVVIDGDRITQVGPAASVRVPEEATIINASGKYLIPGLWDMHAHVLFNGMRDPLLKLLIANGITGIRDMGGEQLDQLEGLKQEIAAGRIVGPRIVASGPIVDGPQPVWPFSISVSDAESGRAAVRALKHKGADFIKVYSLLPRTAYFAIAEEARKQHLPFAGHVPNAITAVEAADAGQRSIDHVRLYLDVSSEETELRAERAAAEAKGSAEFMRVRATQAARLMSSLSPTKITALAHRFARTGTWFVPTLAVHRGFAFLKDSVLINDGRRRYMPADIKNMWATQQTRTPDAVVAQSRAYFEKDLELVGRMHEGGANILAGSDMLNPHVFPGFSLHEELALLVRAGLTPFEALQAATINPASYLGRTAEFGSITVGKRADLILLEANPLDMIVNTERIHTVFARGKGFDTEQRRALLAEVETAFRN